MEEAMTPREICQQMPVVTARRMERSRRWAVKPVSGWQIQWTPCDPVTGQVILYTWRRGGLLAGEYWDGGYQASERIPVYMLRVKWHQQLVPVCAEDVHSFLREKRKAELRATIAALSLALENGQIQRPWFSCDVVEKMRAGLAAHQAELAKLEAMP
jgi:hypothetical protein